ncbi:MAG: stage 0 sporulation family protein [Oscillospiraceae bacterium]
MPEIVGVRFRENGKTYYFDPDGLTLDKGGQVVVETSRGVESGEVTIANKFIGEDEFNQPLKKVVRAATEEDIVQVRENREKEEEALRLCMDKVTKHKLDMKLISAEYAFDRSKVLIYFTSDGRVDFRALVKDLASVLKTRIELRQIGVRDEAKMLGGLGICGREFCCTSFLSDFQPVSIKMAKEQGLSLNPTKISGACGRLMCCLKYEQSAYENLNRITPRKGSKVETPQGVGTVIDVSLLTGFLKVAREDSSGITIEVVHRDDIQSLRDGRPRAERPQPVHTEKEPQESRSGEPVGEDAAKPPRPRSRNRGRRGDRRGPRNGGEPGGN